MNQGRGLRRLRVASGAGRGWVLLGALIVACGAPSGAQPAPRTQGEESVGATAGDRTGDHPFHEAEDVVGLETTPMITVYVQDPHPVRLDDYGSMRPGDIPYEATIQVVNRGDAPAALEAASLKLEVWRDADRVACTPYADDAQPGTEPITTPFRLEPGDARLVRVAATCPLTVPGDYRVRVFLSFAADQAAGEPMHRERHYVGESLERLVDP